MHARITLKEMSEFDAELVFKSWGHNSENFTYLSAPPQRSIEDAQHYIDGILNTGANLCSHIVLGGSRVVGLVKAKIDSHRALIGYVIDQEYWGRGIATTAVMEFLPAVKENSKIERIWATCAINNPGSSRVLEKCGFIREGVLRKWIVYPKQGKQPHDNYSYYLGRGV